VVEGTGLKNPFGSISYVMSDHAVRKLVRFSAFEITLGYAVEAESGHCVGTQFMRGGGPQSWTAG